MKRFHEGCKSRERGDIFVPVERWSMEGVCDVIMAVSFVYGRSREEGKCSQVFERGASIQSVGGEGLRSKPYVVC